MTSGNEEIDSLRIGTQMVSENLGGFLEGFKGERVSIEEYQAFLYFAKGEVEDEYFKDAIEEILGYLDSGDIDVDSDSKEPWFDIAEKFYEESDSWSKDV